MDSQPKRLQAAALFLGAVAVIAGVFAAAYFLYPLQREPRLVKRNYRLLASIAAQVGARIDSLRRAVSTAQNNGKDVCGQAGGPALKCIERKDLPAELRGAGAPVEGGPALEIYAHNDGGVLKVYFLAPAATAAAGAESNSTGGRKIPSTNLGEFLSDAVKSYGYFDTILLASDESSGRVLYQSDIPIVDSRALYYSKISTGRIATIQELFTGEQAAEPEAGANAEGRAGSHSATPPSYVFSPARVGKVRYLGEEYLLFAQPVFTHVLIADGNAAARPARLVLFGLVSERSFESETRQLPWAWLGGLVFLLVLTFLSWPLLRLWLLGPGEPLRSVDVRMISFVSMAAAMLVTFYALDLAFYTSMWAQFDDLLQPLARQVEYRFRREIARANQQLTAIFEDSSCRACDSDDCINADSQRSFADVILIDSAGNPTCRWSPVVDPQSQTRQLRREMRMRQLPLADRSYFRNACSQVLWSVPGPDEKADGGLPPVAVEVVSSRISGDDVLVVARPVAGPAGSLSPNQACFRPTPPGAQLQPAVGLVATTMMPFDHPLLPMGYGFAIIDDQGDVQIHSQNSRNKRENLFRECDDATDVRAAVGTRRPARLDVSYSGHHYRMYVTPLKNTPWSLVVFRDKQLLWAANSEIISSWAMLALLYLAVWILMVIVLQVCDSPYSAEWLWPCRYGGGTRSYWLVGAQNAILAALAYFSLLRAGDLWPLGHFVPLLAQVAMVLVFPALTLALACLGLAERRVLGSWEYLLARIVGIGGGILAVAFVAAPFLLNPRTQFNYHALVMAVLLILLAAVVWTNLRGPKAVLHRDASAAAPALKAGETRLRFAYVSMLFSLVVVLAVVPSMVFFQSASDMEVRNLSRMGQMRWLNSLVDRAKRIRREAEGKIPAVILAGRLDDTADIYPANGFPAGIKWREQGAGTNSGVDFAPAPRPLLIPELLNGLGLPQFTPLMSFAAELRMMTAVRDGGMWSPYSWREGGADGAEIMLVDDDSVHGLLGRTATWNNPALPKTGGEAAAWPSFTWRRFPCFEGRRCWSILSGLAFTTLLAAFVGFAALWSIACKLFLLDTDVNGDEGAAAPADLTSGEQLALWHVMRLGFFSPGDSTIARSLFRRGVLYRGPAFCVRQAEAKQIQQLNPAEMLQRERDARPPAGLRLHHILPAGIALALTFFFVTQRELFNTAIAIVAGVAAALPTVLKFFSQLGGSPEKG